MATHLTTDQVLQLAPDQSAINNSKRLGTASKWVSLGTDGNALWGEIKGSGKSQYQTVVDLVNGFGTKCTCSSRKLPCKHALGLMFVYAQTPADVPTLTAPEWVQDWMDKRAARLANSKSKAVDRDAQAKRAAKRQANIVAGLDELDLWLRDLVRAGFAALPGKPRTFYDKPAKRLVDAQAPSLAERVQALATLPATGDAWVQNMLTELAQIHLIIQGFRRYDALPETVQADLRAAVGWAMQANELAGEPGVSDHWLVLGRAETVRDKLREQRLWLCGTQTGRVALLQDFAYENSGYTNNFNPGHTINAELVYYPSAYPLRATVRAHHGQVTAPDELPGYANFADALAAYATAIAKNPWLGAFPVAYVDVVPVVVATEGTLGDIWRVVDAHGATIHLHPHFSASWELFALSGGHPLWLFGEWNGSALLPLSAANDGTLTAF